jgi:hypothetical protein
MVETTRWTQSCPRTRRRPLTPPPILTFLVRQALGARVVQPRGHSRPSPPKWAIRAGAVKAVTSANRRVANSTMVRTGSAVRVRQRASQSSCLSPPFIFGSGDGHETRRPPSVHALTRRPRTRSRSSGRWTPRGRRGRIAQGRSATAIRGRKDDHRPVDRAELRGDSFDLLPRLERSLLSRAPRTRTFRLFPSSSHFATHARVPVQYVNSTCHHVAFDLRVSSPQTKPARTSFRAFALGTSCKLFARAQGNPGRYLARKNRRDPGSVGHTSNWPACGGREGAKHNIVLPQPQR